MFPNRTQPVFRGRKNLNIRRWWGNKINYAIRLAGCSGTPVMVSLFSDPMSRTRLWLVEMFNCIYVCKKCIYGLWNSSVSLARLWLGICLSEVDVILLSVVAVARSIPWWWQRNLQPARVLQMLWTLLSQFLLLVWTMRLQNLTRGHQVWLS